MFSSQLCNIDRKGHPGIMVDCETGKPNLSPMSNSKPKKKRARLNQRLELRPKTQKIKKEKGKKGILEYKTNF